MVVISKENSVGAWAFLMAVILAVIVGLATLVIPFPEITKYGSVIYAVLIILGLIVGFSINVTGRDSQTFLMTGAIIVLVSKFGMESVISSLIGVGAGDTASSIFASLLALFVPATIVVALKNVFGMAKV